MLIMACWPGKMQGVLALGGEALLSPLMLASPGVMLRLPVGLLLLHISRRRQSVCNNTPIRCTCHFISRRCSHAQTGGH